MKKTDAFMTAIHKIERTTVVRTVRNGLINMIPVLITGAFSLTLKTFPVSAYQTAISTFAGGFLLQLFDLVYTATFGVLSVYMTISISLAFMDIKGDSESFPLGAAAASLLAFFILAGAYLPGFGVDSMGPKSMFLAIITGMGASAFYQLLYRSFNKRRKMLFTAGANRRFNKMLSSIVPIAITAAAFALINEAVIKIFSVDSFRSLLINILNRMFSYGEIGFFKGFFFVLLSSLLWFFGIHGSDTLEDVMQTYFVPGLAANQAAVSSGGTPGVILTKEFFDCFVLMGGCGSTICLLIAIILFSKSNSRRKLSYVSAAPMIFNINELMVFGLPVIFNPTMLVPFITVPLVCYSTAYLALSTGIVPLITNSVEWTTPIILGGYQITGSFAGSVLQIVNVVLGVLIYTPFIRILDKKTEKTSRENYESFTEYFKNNEYTGISVTDKSGVYGEFAKGLCADLRHFMRKYLVMAYQPQYDHSGKCVGAEALLRWKHPAYGMLYPPLVIKLAEEGGFLAELEEAVMLKVLSESGAVREAFGDDIKISFNITGITVVTPRFMQFCRQQNTKYPIKDMNICIEITEQEAVNFDDNTKKVFNELHEMGFTLAIDDFSMGQTSIHYLKDSIFDEIKLDGSLVRGLLSHNNCREIISSIVNLADTLGLTVVAEYVETEEQRDILHSIGCDVYQGYLYSPAVFVSEKSDKK